MSVDASLLPKPRGDDPEDVAWALSTAEALWKRGEYHDAVAWIRKAATAASEADADLRVIELAKAAAELATLVEAFGDKPRPSKIPPPIASPIAQPAEGGAMRSLPSLLDDPEATLDAPMPAVQLPPQPSASSRETSESSESRRSEKSETSIELEVDPVTMSMEPAPPSHSRKPPGPPPRTLSAKPPPGAPHEAPTATTIVHSGVAHSPLSLGSTGVGPSVVSSVEGLARASAQAVRSDRAVTGASSSPTRSTHSSGHLLPTPNPMPSPLQPMLASELDVPVPDDPIFEEAVSPQSVRSVDSRRPQPMPPGQSGQSGQDDLDEDSMPRVPTVPPAPPDDFHPTPMRMHAAPVARMSSDSSRLMTQISLAPVLDVRAENRDAVAIGPAIDVRSAARANEQEQAKQEQTKQEQAKQEPPRHAQQLPPPSPNIPPVPANIRVPAPRLATIRAHSPPPPSAPPPRSNPASIPPPRPLSQRPPAPPPEPLELDLSERASFHQAKLPSVTETHDGLPHLAEPSVLETQQGLGVDMPRKRPSSDALPAVTRPPEVENESAPPPPSFPGLSDPNPRPVVTMSTPAPRGGVSAIDSTRFEALADVPDDERDKILATGEIIALLPDEEIDAPVIVLVLHGELEVRVRGRQSTLEIIAIDQVRLLSPSIPCDGDLVVVGGKKGARILALPGPALDTLRAAAPWVAQDLEPSSDDLHVVAGALRGEMGRRLDDAVLREILGCAETMRLAPGAIVVKNDELVRALVVLGAGALSLRVGDAIDAQEIGTLDPGDVLFPSELLARSKAPSTVRAGPDGAVVLVATRAATEELLVTYPPLLEILGEG